MQDDHLANAQQSRSGSQGLQHIQQVKVCPSSRNSKAFRDNTIWKILKFLLVICQVLQNFPLSADMKKATYQKMANVLGDTLSYRTPPLTVGVFGKWGTGKTRMLRLIKKRMESVTDSYENTTNLSLNLFTLMFRLLYFKPNLQPRERNKIKFVFVDFSILDYAGSDQLWAGILTHVAVKIDEVFGKLSVKLFRAWNYKPDSHLKIFLQERQLNSEHKKRWTISIPAVLVTLALLSALSFIIILWSTYGLPNFQNSEEDVVAVAVTTSFAAILGLGVASKIGDVFRVITNLVTSQAQKVKAMAQKADFSKSLGFMYKVKAEIYYITSIVRYASHLLDMDIRICAIIDDVDQLGTEKIMGLFQVTSLLEYSPNSPYILIMCFDPLMASNMIKKSLSQDLAYDVNGHAYLRKHIELPFHIPALDETNKLRLKVEPSRNYFQQKSPRLRRKPHNRSPLGLHDNDIPLVEIDSSSQIRNAEDEADGLKAYRNSRKIVDECFAGNPTLTNFIDGNARRANRILTSTQLAYRLLEQDNNQKALSSITKLACWNVLVDQWPYRLSWIWQVVEDNTQLYHLDPSATFKFSDASQLLDVYRLVLPKLNQPQDWKNLLDLDSDPETFWQFLSTFQLTVQDMLHFLPATTGLDRSICRLVARSLARMEISVKSQQYKNHLTRWKLKHALQSWTVDDVCNELRDAGLNPKNLEKYFSIVRSNDINGITLLQATPDEFKLQMQMTLGDWVILKNHLSALKTFFGVNRTLSLEKLNDSEKISTV